MRPAISGEDAAYTEVRAPCSGDFMTSAVIYRTGWSILLFSYGAWTLEGDVGDSLSAGAADLQDRKERP